MRKIKFILGVITILVISSCSESVETGIFESQLSEEQIDELLAQTNNDFEYDVFTHFNSQNYLMSDNSSDNSVVAYSVLGDDFILKSTSNGPIVYGPFSTNMIASKIQSRYKMVVRGQSGLATGVYICDVYKYSATINLPIGTLAGYPNSVTPQGFSNYSNQTLGYTYYTASGSSNELNVVSYKIHVLYNALGQTVNKVYPSNLNNVNTLTLIYSYVAP
jgi:hypothetical protein